MVRAENVGDLYGDDSEVVAFFDRLHGAAVDAVVVLVTPLRKFNQLIFEFRFH